MGFSLVFISRILDRHLKAPSIKIQSMNPTKLSVSKSPSNWIPRFYSHEVCWHLNALILVRLEKLFIFSFFSFSIKHWSEIFQNLRVYKDIRWQSLGLTSFYLYCTSLSFGIMKHNANVLVIMVLWSLIKDLFICKTKFVGSVTHCCVQSIFLFFYFFLQKIPAFLKHFFYS